MSPAHLRLGVTLALIVGAAAPAAAQTAQSGTAAQKPPTTLLATVNGRPVTQADLTAATPDIGPELARIPDERARESALFEYRVDSVLAAQQALRENHDKEPNLTARRAYAANKLLADSLLTQVAEQAATEPALRRRYEDLLKRGALNPAAGSPPPSFEEVRGDLARDVALQAQRDFVSELRKSAKIEYFTRPANATPKPAQP